MPVGRILKKNAEFISKQVDAVTSGMDITFDAGAYRPGEAVKAHITLKMSRPMEARGLRARIWCVETERKTNSRVMDAYDYREDASVGVPRSTHIRTNTTIVEKTVYSEEKEIGGPGWFENGTHVVEFRMPAAARATKHSFGDDGKKAVWMIEAKLDIPAALDVRATREIIVE